MVMVNGLYEPREIAPGRVDLPEPDPFDYRGLPDGGWCGYRSFVRDAREPLEQARLYDVWSGYCPIGEVLYHGGAWRWRREGAFSVRAFESADVAGRALYMTMFGWWDWTPEESRWTGTGG